MVSNCIFNVLVHLRLSLRLTLSFYMMFIHTRIGVDNQAKTKIKIASTQTVHQGLNIEQITCTRDSGGQSLARLIKPL